MSSKLPWILVGGGAVAGYLWWRGGRRRESTPSATPSSLGGTWVWPVPAYKGRSPVVSDGFDSPRPGFPFHGGVDIMYKRLPTDTFKPGTPNGSKAFVMPDNTPALAASDGVVWSAMKTPQGYAVVIDHGNRVKTFYTHLDKLFVSLSGPGEKKERVRAGQAIGSIGFSPLDPQRLKHLHFEVWIDGPTNKVDPVIPMRVWTIVVPDPHPTVARNARGSLQRNCHV